MINLLMLESGALLDEPEFLLKADFDKPRMYSGILSAIAGGRSSLGEIANRLNVSSTDLSAYLDRLRIVDLVRVERSLHADDKPKNRRYRLNEQLLSFWHEFIGPNRSAIANGFGEDARPDTRSQPFGLHGRRVRGYLPAVCGATYRGGNRGRSRTRCRSLWGFKDFDIDVAGDLLDGTPFFGEVKWRSAKVDLVRTLRERALASRYESDRPGKVLLFFGRSGFRPEVGRRQRLMPR